MNCSGILNLDKPQGFTSRAIVDKVVQLVRPSKVGHVGTLDPLATGVLVVCVGHATRLADLIQEGRKRYRGRFVLGSSSDTDDITGEVTAGGDWSGVTEVRLQSLLAQFVGRIEQVPPQFSAVHVQGKRAYELARRGTSVDLSSRPVDIYSIRLVECTLPEFELEIECGSGTYIRSIGRDLGQQLGCGALMTALRRLAVGPFDAADATSPELLTTQSLPQYLKPPLCAVSHFPRQVLTDDELTAIRQGKRIAANLRFVASLADNTRLDPPQANDDRTALIGPDGHLIGIGQFDASTRQVQPRIIFPATA